MSAPRTLFRIAALLALAWMLPACAAYHCDGLPNREQCYAAYDQYESCQYQSRPLIRQIGEEWRTDCRTETRSCGRKDKHCRETTREVCRSYAEPIYDYRQYNLGVSACMQRSGLAAYDRYFNRSLF